MLTTVHQTCRFTAICMHMHIYVHVTRKSLPVWLLAFACHARHVIRIMCSAVLFGGLQASRAGDGAGMLAAPRFGDPGE